MSRWCRALVTGASSGIGEAFADELASMGVDLMLVGRDRSALERVASRARANGVHAEVVRADLSRDEDVASVVSALRDARPPVDLLVNNAGVGQWGVFVDLPVDGAVDIIRVNNEALVQLTHAALGPMLDSGRGTVIQVASMASAAPGPQQAVYAASKAFVSSFGQATSTELTGTPVTCTTLLPGFTRTNYFARVGLSPDIPDERWMSAEQVARASLEGAREGRPLVIPGARNRWKVVIATPFPSLGLGRAKRGVRQALNGARAVRRRLTERGPTPAPPPAPR
jgi:short-subunit dehydrogenase